MASAVLSFGGKEIKTYPLTKPAMVVGRDPSADIVIDNLGVSRAHCQFLRRGSAYILQDMNSSNGTYVNGQKVGEHYLNDNDQVVVGKYTLTFKNEQQATAAPAAEKIVPDSLNTYMMDGDKIRERLEQMRRAEAAKSAAAAPTASVPVPAAPAPAAAAPAAPAAAPAAPAAPAAAPSSVPAADRHARIVIGGSLPAGPSAAVLRRYLYFSLAVNIILALVICLLLFLREMG